MAIKTTLGWFSCLLVGALVLAMPGRVLANDSDADDHDLVFHRTAHDMLFAVSMQGKHGFAVGDFGLIAETNDGGVTWEAQPNPPTDLALTTIAQQNGHCIVGGQTGLILVAPDCKTWKSVNSTTTNRILDIALGANGTAYAVGGFGTILKSTDWGKTWTAPPIDWSKLLDNGDQPHLYQVHVDAAGEVMITGEFGLIFVSDDGGNHWTVRHEGDDDTSLFGLAFAPNGEIFAVGQEGTILKSADKGVTWTSLNSGTKYVLTSILALPGGRLVASGIHIVTSSNDDGKTWQADTTSRVRLGWNQDLAVGAGADGHPSILVVGSGAAISSIPE